nr:Rhodanese-like domain-containing protein 4, chloroplastic [Ipomoea batatas]
MEINKYHIISGELQEGVDAVTVGLGVAAVAGIGALAFSKDGKKTFQQVDEFLNTKAVPEELVDNIKVIMILWNFMFIRSDLHQPQAWKYVLQESSMGKIGIEVRNGFLGGLARVMAVKSASISSPEKRLKTYSFAAVLSVLLFHFFRLGDVHGSCPEINKLLADSLDIIVAIDGDFNRGNCRVSSNGHVSGDPI